MARRSSESGVHSNVTFIGSGKVFTQGVWGRDEEKTGKKFYKVLKKQVMKLGNKTMGIHYIILTTFVYV